MRKSSLLFAAVIWFLLGAALLLLMVATAHAEPSTNSIAVTTNTVASASLAPVTVTGFWSAVGAALYFLHLGPVEISVILLLLKAACSWLRNSVLKDKTAGEVGVVWRTVAHFAGNSLPLLKAAAESREGQAIEALVEKAVAARLAATAAKPVS
jgi:hypothetical protein